MRALRLFVLEVLPRKHKTLPQHHVADADAAIGACPSRAVSLHGLTHRLAIFLGLAIGRFPEVPTLRLAGFPYCKEGLLRAGYNFVFLFFWPAPLGRGELFFGSPDLSRQAA